MANIERLTQLRRVIEEAPEDRLHMRNFSEKAPCGTAYCAAGWAAVDPWFQKNTSINASLRVGLDGRIDVVADSDDVFDELADIFGIDDEDASNLFGGELGGDYDTSDDSAHSVSKAEVLENIDRLLAGDSAEPYACISREYSEED